MKFHDIIVSSDPKVMASAGGSLVSWIIAISEQFGPVVDIRAGVVAILAGLMAIAWTGINIYDRIKGNKTR